MKIVLVNDDGPFSTGVTKLRELLEKEGFETYVFVPHQEMSASSHALTLSKPLHVKEIEKNYFIVDGTPADCAYVAMFYFLKDMKIDYVISGINRGYNMGEDVFYSGTVAGAMEGFFHKVNGIAVSAKDFSNIDNVATHFVNFFKTLSAKKIKKPFLLNINYPEGDIKGIKFTSLSSRLYPGNIVECVDPRGVKSYWIGGVPAVWNGEKDSDINAVKEGYVSVTPIKADITDRDFLQELKSIF